MPNLISRRGFLRASSALASVAITPGPAFAAASGAGYKALVCIELVGGNDSFNMLVPRSRAEHSLYAASRQNLAIARDDLLPIAPATADGIDYGLHPAMTSLARLFDEERVSFVTNVGPLIQPVTKEAYFSGTATLPPGLFSHKRQRAQWGRTADVSHAPDTSTLVAAASLGTQLEAVARRIAERDRFDSERQVFHVKVGGFDTHDRQNERQPTLLAGFSDAIAAFYRATEALGVAEQVTTYTQSDFGRTLTSNGCGSDHGWGGNQVVVGGALKGADLYGTYPLLELGGDADIGGGRMIPTTSADQYTATLGRWFGVPEAQLIRIAPNIDNFAVRDLGFLAQTGETISPFGASV